MKEVKQIGEGSKGKAKISSCRKKSSHDTKIITVPFPWLYTSIVLFLTVPLFIFFLGYLRLPVGIPLTLIFVGIVCYSVSDCLNDPDGVKLSKQDHDLKIPVSYLIGFAVTALFISYVSGVGEYIYSFDDHEYRRAILRDLINYDWPVIFSNSTQTNPEVIKALGTDSGNRALLYYFIYWLPSAVAGKTFGFEIGNLVLLLWNSIGIFLTFLAVSLKIKKITAWVPFFYVFFSGLDIIPDFVYLFTEYNGWHWYEGYVPVMSYVSNFRELASVNNQMVPCFLIVALLLLSKNTRSMGLTAGIMFCYSPWAVFGILPMVGAILFGKKNKAKKMLKNLQNLFSVANITSALLLLFVFGSFYLSNSEGVDYRGFAWTFYDHPIMFIPCYIVFIAIEVLPFVVILFKREKNNAVFWAVLVTLMILPWYKVSDVNDLSMRGSMPALFFLCISLCAVVSDVMDKKNTPATKSGWIRTAAIMLTVIIMMFTTFINLFIIFGSVIKNVPGEEETVGSFGNIRDESRVWYCMHNYMCEDYEEQFFFRYLARKN